MNFDLVHEILRITETRYFKKIKYGREKIQNGLKIRSTHTKKKHTMFIQTKLAIRIETKNTTIHLPI